MCGGGSKAPTIIYQGPSQEEIDANNAQLETYRQQMSSQQDTFAKQLQEQIDAANQQTALRQRELSQQQDAANAAAANRQMTAYAVTATQSENAEGAQTTTTASAKPKPKGGLKITPGGSAPTSPGTGLNIGI
jgi:peptidoglycan hydrolase CwlO-like protein